MPIVLELTETGLRNMETPLVLVLVLIRIACLPPGLSLPEKHRYGVVEAVRVGQWQLARRRKGVCRLVVQQAEAEGRVAGPPRVVPQVGELNVPCMPAKSCAFRLPPLPSASTGCMPTPCTAARGACASTRLQGQGEGAHQSRP